MRETHGQDARPPANSGRYVERLLEIPFIEDASLRAYSTARRDLWDYLLEIVVSGRRRRLFVEEKRAPFLSPALIEDLAIRSSRLSNEEWILFAPFISASSGARLREKGINYVDLAGNCHLRIDRSHVATIEGRKSVTSRGESRGIGSAGYRVIFTLMTRPQLLGRPVREVADHAGVSKSGVSLALRHLERDGFLGKTKTHSVLTRPRALLERWLVGYESVLRPRLLFGRFDSQIENRSDLDKMITNRLSDRSLAPGTYGDTPEHPLRWAWGGTAAAFQMTGHYRGTETILHFPGFPAGVPRLLGFRPSAFGEIVLLGVPAPIAFESGQTLTVNPLLIYTELVASKEERANEAAAIILDRYLQHLL